jgi:hypothetical protein
MLFVFLLTFAKSYNPDDFNIKTYTACPDQNVQFFAIKKFNVYHPLNSRGLALQITLVAELSQKVQEPYLEIQILNQRIPLIRKKDILCRPGILICPASFSQLVYGVSVPIPNTIPLGEYKLRLIFKEGTKRLSCYETPISIKKLNLPEEKDEEFGYEYEQEVY